MKKKPLVSVICLCYNHAKFVVESLNSVLSQSYENIELIIIDDFSSDDSVHIIETWLKKHPKIVFLKNETNLGNTKTFNKAFEICNGEFVIDLACDDVLMPDCISKQVHEFENSDYKNLAIVYGNSELISENNQFIKLHFEVDANQKTIEKIATGNVYESILSGETVLNSVAAMIKTSVLRSIHGYDETLSYEDLDVWIRIARNFEVTFIDEILVQKRIVENSLGTDFFRKKSLKSQKINQSTLSIFQKVYQINKTISEDRAILKRLHFDMILNYKNNNFSILIQLLWLELKFRTRIIFKSNSF